MLGVQTNPNVPKKARGHVPFDTTTARYVVAYRLLGFDLWTIGAITGVAQRWVRAILLGAGRCPRRGRHYLLNKGYEVRAEIAENLQLGPLIPRSTGPACIGLDAFDWEELRLLKLPDAQCAGKWWHVPL